MAKWFSVPVVDGILIRCERNRIWKSSKLCASNKTRMFSQFSRVLWNICKFFLFISIIRINTAYGIREFSCYISVL